MFKLTLWSCPVRTIISLLIFLSSPSVLPVNSQLPCPDHDTKYVRDPDDCTRYVVCVNGRAFVMPPCTASTIWSNTLRACVHSGSAHDDCTYGDLESQTGTTEKDTDYPTTRSATPTQEGSQITTKNYWTSSIYFPTTTRSPPLPTTTAPPPPITSAPVPPEPSATPWSDQGSLRGRCGIARTPYIIGGSPSSQGVWPWQVSLQVRSDVLAHRCGGVLVTSQWVLTAAHCVYGIFSAPPLYVAVIGEYNLVEHSGDEQYRGVEKIIRHHDYTAEGGYPNDIALVKLSHSIDAQYSAILPACIPYQGEEYTYQDNCFITGWGETEGHTDRRILHELPIQIRSRDYCRKVWGDTYVEHSHICVGDGDTGACQGDSGGPLVCRRRGRYYVAGLASWAVVGCRRAGYPNAFTRVSNFVTWIEETIERN